MSEATEKCPTCGNAMELIEDHSASWNFPVLAHHCTNCGTVAQTSGLTVTYRVPKLVDRVRQLAVIERLDLDHQVAAVWHQIGLIESIYPPESRPRPNR